MQPQDFSAQHSSRKFTWNFNAFHHCFIRPKTETDSDKNHRLNLKSQEDLKALVWAYGGPRPSLITSVAVTVDPIEATVIVSWEDTIPNDRTSSDKAD